MNYHVRAILWAQLRSLLNYFPKTNKTGLAFGTGLALLWYGMWVGFSLLAARVFADPGNVGLAGRILAPGLLFVFLYWQVIPVLLVSAGVSLSTRKLQMYPIPNSQLFLIELLLRISTSFEMILILTGLAVGLFANPRLPKWSPLPVAGFAVFNLCVSAGTREMMVRLFERKRVREVAVLLLAMTAAIPQFLIVTHMQNRVGAMFQRSGSAIWPWSATASLALGIPAASAILSLAAWMAAAYWFGRWQFARTLRFDADESNATSAGKRGSRIFDQVLRWPSLLFHDPLAALVEKEIRFLSRAPRFRMVFAMGFTFGLGIWLPLAISTGPEGSFHQNFLAFTSVYSLLLVGDVCFWNTFGFDRAAAQAYWAMPVRFSTVLAGKNISALFFVLLETTLITCICTVLRMPVTGMRVLEAYAVTLTASLYLISLGNLTSTSQARAINPAKAMRSGSPGRLQALLIVLYPLSSAPVLLAYAARYAFGTEAAFFGVLAISMLIGAAVYWVSLESSVEAAERNKERLLTSLAQGEGLIQG